MKHQVETRHKVEPNLQRVLDRAAFHAVYDDSILDALKFARANGFAGIQAAVELPHLSIERLTGRQCAAIRRFREANDLSLSLHGPDAAASLFQTSRPLLRGIFGYYRALFDFAGRIGAGLVTIHSGARLHFRTDTSPVRLLPAADAESFRRAFDDNLRRLLDLANGRFILCLENGGWMPDLAELVQLQLDSGRLHLCWDLAKTYRDAATRDAPLERFMWRNLARIRQVHLHDRRDGLTHAVLGTGTVDFMRFLPRLARADVKQFCIEVRPREKALVSLRNLRKMAQAR
jgi:sugar phosphate isomerase/epimerase